MWHTTSTRESSVVDLLLVDLCVRICTVTVGEIEDILVGPGRPAPFCTLCPFEAAASANSRPLSTWESYFHRLGSHSFHSTYDPFPTLSVQLFAVTAFLQLPIIFSKARPMQSHLLRRSAMGRALTKRICALIRPKLQSSHPCQRSKRRSYSYESPPPPSPRFSHDPLLPPPDKHRYGALRTRSSLCTLWQPSAGQMRSHQTLHPVGPWAVWLAGFNLREKTAYPLRARGGPMTRLFLHRSFCVLFLRPRLGTALVRNRKPGECVIDI